MPQTEGGWESRS